MNQVKDASWGKKNKVFFTLNDVRHSVEVSTEIWENEVVSAARQIIIEKFPEITNKGFQII